VVVVKKCGKNKFEQNQQCAKKWGMRRGGVREFWKGFKLSTVIKQASFSSIISILPHFVAHKVAAERNAAKHATKM
jgi:hypothetical protein